MSLKLILILVCVFVFIVFILFDLLGQFYESEQIQNEYEENFGTDRMKKRRREYEDLQNRLKHERSMTKLRRKYRKA